MKDLEPPARERLYRDLFVDERYHLMRATFLGKLDRGLNFLVAACGSAALVGAFAVLEKDTPTLGKALIFAAGVVVVVASGVLAAYGPGRRAGEHARQGDAYARVLAAVLALKPDQADELEALERERAALERAEEETFHAVYRMAQNRLCVELNLEASDYGYLSRRQRCFAHVLHFCGIGNPTFVKNLPEKPA